MIAKYVRIAVFASNERDTHYSLRTKEACGSQRASPAPAFKRTQSVLDFIFTVRMYD